MKLPRRRFLHLAAAAAALPAVPRIARAQSYPARAVHIIVGVAAGGPNDTVARLLGQWLSERLGQQFVVENRTGAGGNIATEAVVRSPADGYTLLLVTSANAVNVTLYDKSNFNFLTDIAPVAAVMRVPNVMVVNPSVPAKTVPEFIAYAKANPGKINMATAGNGTTPHMSGELFKQMAGVDLVPVAYRGGAPALIDLIAGQDQVMFEPTISTIAYVRGRQAARAGGDHRDPLGAAARHPDRERIRAGIRSEPMVRHRRPAEHAVRDHRQAQPGDQHGHGRSQADVTARRAGGYADPDDDRRIRQVHLR